MQRRRSGAVRAEGSRRDPARPPDSPSADRREALFNYYRIIDTEDFVYAFFTAFRDGSSNQR